MTSAEDTPQAAPPQVPGRRLPRLVLASRSPRRRSLLTEHGIEHESIHPGFDDGSLSPGNVTPEQWVAALAYLKAWAGAQSLGEESSRLLLGADTACLMDGQMIGTPSDAAEAERMIRGFMERDHEVLTGVALVEVSPAGRVLSRHLFVDRATVNWGRVSEGQIRDYIASGAWAGKAGAYNLRERLEAGWPIRYDGDPSTIMGLPMKALIRSLGRLSAPASSVVGVN
jgi:septum formation protein